MNTETTGYFVGYRIDGFDRDHTTPIATGRTREEAQGKAIRRVLDLCDINSSIGVQECRDLTQAQFDELTVIVDGWAAKHGIDIHD